MKTKLSVKDWAEEDRPREKLFLKGVYSLSDAELLAIIIGSGNREETVVELAQRILAKANNNINELGKLSVKELVSQFKGIGKAKAISIVAALELGKRRKVEDVKSQNRIRFSKDIFDYFHPILGDLYHEEFWALYVNRANKIIAKVKISQGGVSETVVDSKLIYREAINRLASGVAICHNHPSGNNKPSHQDDMITMKIKRGIEMLDMTFLDHIILCDACYYSYADEGRL